MNTCTHIHTYANMAMEIANANTHTAKMVEDHEEELLNELGNRFVMFPIKYQAIWNMYKKAESAFWTAEELDLTKDMNDWEKLADNERHFIKMILAFFAASDGIVNENLGARFLNEVKAPEARAFYGFQIAMENIHCVSGDTEVFTKYGYQSIEYLAKHKPHVEVWNGEKFSPVQVVQTSEDAPLFKVTLSNGMSLNCTSQHKWIIQGSEDRVYTEDLKPGMCIQEFEYPVAMELSDPEMFSNPRKHGVECGSNHADGSYNIHAFGMRPKYFVPVNYGIETKIDWLNGLFSTESTEVTSLNLTFKSYRLEFVKHVQRLLTTLGVHSTIVLSDTSPCTLSIDTYNLNKLSKLGLSHSSIPSDFGSFDVPKSEKTVTVENVIKLGFTGPTFCFNEPERHVGFFNGIATGQSETYSLLIDTYIKNPQEKNHLFNAIQTIPCIKKKADWALRWIENQAASFATRLIAFACVEGIFFSGAFCSIFWLKERGVMPGLCLSNEFISRDEGLHTEFAILLYSMIKNKPPAETVYAIVKEAVEIEDEFINDSIPCSMLGMNASMMSQYIKFVADRLLVQLGYDKVWNVTCPFDFMERIGLDNKSNFFEHTRISEYAKANVGGNVADKHKFSLEEDF